MERERLTRGECVLLLVALTIGLIGLRIALFPVVTADVRDSFLPWLQYVIDHGRWRALQTIHGDYFPSYYIILVAISYTRRIVPPLYELKLLQPFVEGATALLAYKTVPLLTRPEDKISSASLKRRSIAAAFAILAAPTVILNGSAWGQCDILYTSLLLGSVYCILTSRKTLSAICFALALCLKLQPMFLGPFLVVALLRKKLRLWQSIFIPAAWMVAALPMLMQGRSFRDSVAAPVTQAGELRSLVTNAANPWEISSVVHLPYRAFLPAGLLLGVWAAVWLIRVCMRWKTFDAQSIFLAATLSLTLMPYVLPKMHDRYFFPAEIFLIVLAAIRTEFILPAALLECSSLLCYLNYFNQKMPLPLTTVVPAVLASTAAVIFMVRRFAHDQNAKEEHTSTLVGKGAF
jgi:Gpi18-like mannosyltransferase